MGKLKNKINNMNKTKPIIQVHHITYEPERTVRIYKGEHWAITQLQRRKRISKGFIEALEQWIVDNKSKAIVV